MFVAQLLFVFSILFIAWCVHEIVTPFLRQQAHLLRFYTLFLSGSIVFVGVAAIDVALNPRAFLLNHILPNISEESFYLFMLAVLVFFTVMRFSYKRALNRSRLPAKIFGFFPGESDRAKRVLFWFFATVVVLSFFASVHPILGYLSAIASFNCIVLMTVLVVHEVIVRQKTEHWITFLVVFTVCLVLSMTRGSGRRDMVACLSTIPVVIYFYRARVLHPPRVIRNVAILGIVSILVLNGYSGLRYRAKNTGAKIDLSYHLETLRSLPMYCLLPPDANQSFGQGAVRLSMVCIEKFELRESRVFEQKPFFNTYYVLGNPIPRFLWDDKPEALGHTLPRDLGFWSTGYVNVGPGIVGHFFHEGGLFFAVFYGWIFGYFLGVFDDLLRYGERHPLVLGLLCTTAGQFVGFSRGDIGVFGVHIIASCVTVGFVCFFCYLIGLPSVSHDTRNR
ncbi:hypothetical protein CA13_53390 [Planctomycetes bacterium CA13]|uniref:Oligosaccharide repeat unit polymerase n=1 Tax=Novipirellula herctigrandis TaxID=2527986 RepID=A0A5C5Z9T9_9BACT|nr:hypothetical protein CA13_53390 [Planctomycetes bacterium CA13]